uniref:BHLH domain-containing protein n=1 Tax=Rhabditophanes sp. KR3021 TaxID=114890 RepID=A0AC35U481_9BILA
MANSTSSNSIKSTKTSSKPVKKINRSGKDKKTKSQKPLLTKEELTEMNYLREIVPTALNCEDPAVFLQNVATYIGSLTTRVVQKVHAGELPKDVMLRLNMIRNYKRSAKNRLTKRK